MSSLGADALVDTLLPVPTVSSMPLLREEYGGPLIILDFGIATTFDVINADGNHVGGVIAPGINLSAEALHWRRCCPASAAPPQPDWYTHDTSDAVRHLLGYVGLIEGLWTAYARNTW